MKSEVTTTAAERKSRLAPLGRQLKSLQFGQRIQIEFPEGSKKTPFHVVLATYRASLKMSFLYEKRGPGLFEVWLGTPEQARAGHRGLRHVQTCMTEAELDTMRNTPAVDREWTTLISLAMRCGIPVSTGRRVRRTSLFLEQREIEVLMRSAIYPVRRRLPEDLVQHLQGIQPESMDDLMPVCPTLYAMPNREFHDSWARLRRLLKLPVSRSLSALTWPWKHANPGQRDREIALNHITALERKWLSPAELTILSKRRDVGGNVMPLTSL